MESIFEQMGGTYRLEGDYLVPNLVLPDTNDYQIGRYGRMRRRYLKEHRKALYAGLTLEGTLFQHLAEIDQSCNERMDAIISAMADREGVTEELKAADQIEWGERAPVVLKLRTDRAGRRDRCISSIQNRAEEIVMHELVYSL